MQPQLALIVGAYLAIAELDPQTGSSKSDVEWIAYKNQYNRKYQSDDLGVMRHLIFESNRQHIIKFNSEKPESQMFQLGLNEYADWSSLEVQNMLGFRRPQTYSKISQNRVNNPYSQAFLEKFYADFNETLPDEVDWRNIPGKVSKVKNQGACGSCWAFATTGALEGQELQRMGKNTSSNLIDLSEQNLVDCVDTSYGCRGGTMEDAMNYIKKEGGIDDETSYPYEARTKKCRFRKDKVAFSDAGSAILPVGDEQKLKEVVAKFGPVSVAIDASSLWFQLYHKGVYVNKRCKNKSDDLDHAVLVVGYGTDKKKGDYWIVKNSWGSNWGQKGYILMARNRGNMCGIATEATIPIF